VKNKLILLVHLGLPLNHAFETCSYYTGTFLDKKANTDVINFLVIKTKFNGNMKVQSFHV